MAWRLSIIVSIWIKPEPKTLAVHLTRLRGGECHGNREFGRFLLAAKTYSLQDLRNEGQKIWEMQEHLRKAKSDQTAAGAKQGRPWRRKFDRRLLARTDPSPSSAVTRARLPNNNNGQHFSQNIDRRKTNFKTWIHGNVSFLTIPVCYRLSVFTAPLILTDGCQNKTKIVKIAKFLF